MKLHESLAGALALALITPSALAQDPVPVAQEGDAVAGVGTITSIFNLAINDVGEWLVEADTDNADTDTDSVVLSPAGLALREGQALLAPAGALLGSFDSLSLARDGITGANYFLDGPPSGQDSGVYLDLDLQFQEGDVVNDPSVSPGTPFIGFFDVKRSDSGHFLTVATMDDPAIASTVDQVLYSTIPGVGNVVRWKEGDILPGQTEAIATFGTGPHQSAVDGDLGILFFADLEGDTAVDGVIYFDDGVTATKIAQEGDPSPVAGRNWSSLSSPEVAVNDLGQIAYSGSLDGDTASNLLIVLDGAKFIQEGDSLPAIAPNTFTSFGSGPLCLARTGDLLWYGDWNDANTDIDTGLFLGTELIVQEGVSTVNGVVIDSLSGVQDGYAMSGNGRWILFEATLVDGTNGAYLIDRSLGTITSACQPPTNNSTGLPGRLAVTGYDTAGGLPLRLSSWDLPPNEFGYFLLSQTTANVPFPGGSQGILCLGGGIGRFNLLVASTGDAGYLEIGVDTTAVPVNPVAPILAGQTWTFQCWHRDTNPGQTSNFSEAVSVTFN